ncbi:hypothetical protein [Candidatus Poriferisodalis sp.]|uniref:hypothetical protein n=1 Tax=Candidatus Poriferisodalis sp. TaxID=3101277 RepID=UPI003B027824
MSLLGKPDDLYVRARRALLDAAEALAEHLHAVVLVGAQALYLHTGDAELAVAEYTTDADFAIHPSDLADEPLIADLLEAIGFTTDGQPGRWSSSDGIPVDLMVPEQLAGPGSRGADLGPHGRRTARRAKGLEAALVDRERRTIKALDPADDRSIEISIAGPGALLVAKVHKIADRSTAADRLSDKDALDVLRLLQSVSTDDLCARLVSLQRNDLSGSVTNEAIAQADVLFGAANGIGVRMAMQAVGTLENPDFVASSMVALVGDLLDELAARPHQGPSN